MIRYKALLSLSGLAFLLFSCQEEATLSPAQVDSALVETLDQFLEEATQRSYTISDELLQQLDVQRVDTLTGLILGQCVKYTNGRRAVVISADYWQMADFLEREYLVFHELGHCLLNREHLNTRLPDGTCASMMQSGSGSCRNAYSWASREAYLDELFENAP